MKWFTLAFLAYLISVMAACGPRVGSQGKQGDPGPQGVAGQNGTDGVDATPVTMVQLCPGTTHYPDTFCETSFCVAGTLYATYSANGGFSVEIPPGRYSSNGINCSCSFTVLPNCQVTP